MSGYLTLNDQAGELIVELKNDWVFANVTQLQEALEKIDASASRAVTFNCGGLKAFDLSGAWLLFQKSRQMKAQGRTAEFEGFRREHFKFLQHTFEVAAATEYDPHYSEGRGKSVLREGVEWLGHSTTDVFESIGCITRNILDGIRNISVLAVGETIRQIDETGVRAIPIVFIICFLMGIVLAFQAAGQLEQFGAQIFVVDLVANAVLREIGVLLAAIMVAGRSGAAFAAALGTMKLNEEVDALRVMGLNPNQILIIPRVVGLVIALPMLTIFGNAAGLAGGLFICLLSLDLTWWQFVERLAITVDVQDVMVGLSKAPVFAFLIAAIGTVRGMQVQHSAEELGRLTTFAVVQSIFLIILADAFFTILYQRLGL